MSSMASGFRLVLCHASSPPQLPHFLLCPPLPPLCTHVTCLGGRLRGDLAQSHEHRSLCCGFICAAYTVCVYVGVFT